jgi:hypothetical protein
MQRGLVAAIIVKIIWKFEKLRNLVNDQCVGGTVVIRISGRLKHSASGFPGARTAAWGFWGS